MAGNSSAFLLCREIKVELCDKNAAYHDDVAMHVAKKRYGASLERAYGKASFVIYKKSVDARDKNRIVFLYTVAIFPEKPLKAEERMPRGFEISEHHEPEFSCHLRNEKSERPVVVGFGPAGIFCAYALAKAGLEPVVIERGSDVDHRSQKVEAYWKKGVLDTETNVQFGEGGAGTFSDGKLLTRISDPLCSYVLQTLVDFGAPKEIRVLAKPHVGTDNLRTIVKNMRNEILRLGGKIYFDTKFSGFSTTSDGHVSSVTVNDTEKIRCTALFLCIGHSARDTFSVLMQNGMCLEPKPFSVGVRVEHLQEDIDTAMHGRFAHYEALGHAQYTLSAKKDGRAVYSFCMCPGGVVVASASDAGEIVTNGMSYYARDGKNANSAIAVSVDPTDYGNSVEGAIAYQKKIEQDAFLLAGADGAAPVQTLGDFLGVTTSSEPQRVLPTYTGKTQLCAIDSLFRPEITEMLRFGFHMFEKRIYGFSAPDAVLTAPETRTSSPVRIPRNESGMASSFCGVYPCGEGAGYAGGITSAAVDGLKGALQYLQALC